MVKQYLAALLKKVAVTGERWTRAGKTEGMLAVLEENKNVRTEASLQFARRVVNGSTYVTQHITRSVFSNSRLNQLSRNLLRFSPIQIANWHRYSEYPKVG